MKSRPALRSGLSALTVLLTFALCLETSAQSVATTPVGAVTVTIAAGTGTSRVVTPLAFPLIDSASGTGLLKGEVSGFSANTIINSDAGWLAGQFSDPAIPYFIRITSGSASGRTFLISTSTASTSTEITIDSEEAGLVNLTEIGLAAGDSYAIYPCDTLSTLFGTPTSTGVLGGTLGTGADADIVYIMLSGGWRQYYYNTGDNPGWKRIGLNTSSNNIPIRPDAMVLYSRIGNTAMNLTLTGEVPSPTRIQILKKSGVTPLANPWPAGVTTLLSTGLADTIGWVKSSDYTQADIVFLMVSGGWRQYFHDGVNWKRVGLNSISDSVEIPVGSGVQISKRGIDSSSVAISPTSPYTF